MKTFAAFLTENRKTPPAWWHEPSDNAFAKGMTKGEVILDWLARNRIPKQGDQYQMYHATPKASGFTVLRPGSYLTDDPATAKQQAGRDRGPKAGKIVVYSVLFYPWELQSVGTWAITAVPIPLGPLATS